MTSAQAIDSDVDDVIMTVQLGMLLAIGRMLEGGSDETDAYVIESFAGLADPRISMVSFKHCESGFGCFLVDAFDGSSQFGRGLAPENVKVFGGGKAEIPKRDAIGLPRVLD
jgi:hypothetical protein